MPTNFIVTTVYKSIIIGCSRLVSAYTSVTDLSPLKFLGRTLGWYDFAYNLNEDEHHTLRTLLFAGTKFSDISDLPNFR